MLCGWHTYLGKGGKVERGVEGRHGINMVVFLTRAQRRVQ